MPDTEQMPNADAGPLDQRVVPLPTESDRTCEQGCNGCDDCTDYDDEPDDQCLHCRGDGMDPDCDYLLPCPDCGGSW